tara:strand:+ start:651 stop:1904 length:1254 start_codon:yes stop_codon:yes gene_type:complete
MKRGFLIVLFIFSLIEVSLAQEINSIPKQIRGIVIGGNFSKIYYDGKRQTAAFAFPATGINATFQLKNKLFLGSTLLFSNAKSQVTPSIIVRQNVAQILLGPTLQIDDVKLNAGFSFEYRTAPSLQSVTESPINLMGPVGEESFQVNFMTGVEFYLSPIFTFCLNGIIPSQQVNSSSIQFGLKYRFHAARAEKIQNHRQHVKAMAKKDIVLLKEGALLVRLKTSDNTIVALRNAGREKQALKEEKWQLTQNQKIVKAFKTCFDFAPVYFFYSDKSNQVRKGDFEGIFLNEKLELDSTIVMSKQNVFTAEYTAIKQDTFIQVSHYELEQIGDFQSLWVPRYYGQPNFGFSAFVVKNQNFEQMVEPFPYYARTNAPGIQKHPEQLLFGLPLIYFIFNSSYDSAVEALNRKLNAYYIKSQ